MKLNQGTCPACNGTKRQPIKPEQERYASVYSGYDKETHTLPCSNCGGQYMFGKPSGEVNLNTEGKPCLHSYTSEKIGRCLHRYTCVHCADSYSIDSGD
jgi:hypothetical protein